MGCWVVASSGTLSAERRNDEMKTARCKFTVESVTHQAYGGRTVKLATHYDAALFRAMVLALIGGRRD
jgi:hypothetical protein